MKIHSSIFLGIPVHLWWISPTVWHTSASIRDISTTCDANATLSIHLQSGGAIAVQRNHTGCYLATGAQRPRTACVYLGWGYLELYIPYCTIWMDFKTSHFLQVFLENLPISSSNSHLNSLREKVWRLGGSFRGQSVAAFHVLSWRGKTRQVQPFPDRTCKHPWVFSKLQTTNPILPLYPVVNIGRW